jgi:hypothetical protein
LAREAANRTTFEEFVGMPAWAGLERFKRE